MSDGINGQTIFQVWGAGSYQAKTENFIDSGGSNGIQTFFMSREEVTRLNETQCKKYGMLDFETMKVKKYINGKWIFED